MKHHSLHALVACLSFTVATQAQTWTEQNAGDLPNTAEAPPGNGLLSEIVGTLSSSTDADVFAIRIDDPTQFTARSSSTADTQLFLFDANGFGVTHHDNISGGNLNARITGQFVPTGGLYYLAISKFDRDPTSGGLQIWLDAPSTTERTPDGPGAAGAIGGWNGAGAAGSQGYTIFLTGVSLPYPHGARNPGSVLVYPVHRSSLEWFTLLSVTNTALSPILPTSLGGTTNIHVEYVNVEPNPADPFRPLSCSIFDRVETLTPADTFTVLTACHNVFDLNGKEGYIVVSAEDPTQAPGYAWDHDYLIGTMTVISKTGITFSFEAISFEALKPFPAVAPDELKFDNIHYNAIRDTHYIDNFIGVLDTSLALINLTGPPSAINTVLLQVWNDDERALSATRPFSCWFDQPLSVVSQLFTQSFLSHTANNPQEFDVSCDGVGDFETGWAIVDSIAVQYPSGQSISSDGALLGAMAPTLPGLNNGRLLWESRATQTNGAFRTP